MDGQGRAGSPEVPATLKKDLSQVNADLYTAVSLWLRKHGKGVKPKLSDEQRQQLKECFELMDQDGSGTIDAEELGAAFKLLGIRMKRAELEALLAEVDHDQSGVVEYPEFLEIMTVTLQRLTEEEDSDKNEGQVPFALMATAYRRKRLMEGIINGDREVQAQIAQISDKANLEALQATKAAEVEAMRGKGPSDGSPSGSQPRVPAGSLGGYGALAGNLPGGRSPSGRPLRRIGQVDVSKQILGTLGPDERRLVTSLTGKLSGSTSRAPPPPLTSTRPYGHFTQSPAHRQLMEAPQLLDLRFVHQSAIKLPPGLSAARSMSGGSLGSGGGGASPSAVGRDLPGAGRSSARVSVAGAAPMAGTMSPRRDRSRSDESPPLPLLRFEGAPVANLSTRQPMGRTLGTFAGAQR